MPSNKVHNYVFKNSNGLLFDDVSTDWGFNLENLTNGAAYADLDNDGDVDLVMNNLDEVAQIYRNNAEVLHKNNFLKIKLKGDEKNTFGLGATVTIFCGDKLINVRCVLIAVFNLLWNLCCFRFRFYQLLLIHNLGMATGKIRRSKEIKANQNAHI